MKEGLILGIDIGTQGTKVLVTNSQGEVKGVANHSYEFNVPQVGWAEQHPLLWWDAVQSALKKLWQKGIDPKEVKAIGVAGQMHSLVLLDKEREELGTAILWNDVRTKEECEEIETIVGKDRLLQVTRNSVLPGFTAPKLLWVKKNEPERYAKINHMMQPKDYIVFKLSGALSSDVSDASGTSLFNVAERAWSKEIIEALDIPFEWLNDVHESQTVVGNVTQGVSELTGIPSGVPVVAGAGDNAAAALGNGIFTEGTGVVSVGTSGTVFIPLNSVPKVDGEQFSTLHLFCHCLPNTWHAMGVTLSAGMSLNWYKNCFTDLSYDELLANIEQLSAGSEGLVFLPYLNGERTPHNDPNAKGIFYGINYHHTKDHFTRAVLEGVSFSLKDCLELMKELKIHVDKLYVTGGAAKSPIWRNILAEILNFELGAFEEREGPAFGAALLAGLGTGVWDGTNNFPDCFGKSQVTNIDEENVRTYEKVYETYKELYQCLKPLYSKEK